MKLSHTVHELAAAYRGAMQRFLLRDRRARYAGTLRPWGAHMAAKAVAQGDRNLRMDLVFSRPVDPNLRAAYEAELLKPDYRFPRVSASLRLRVCHPAKLRRAS